MPNVVTVTLNPVIDLIYLTGCFEKGTTFRCNGFMQLPAGKGLSVSIALSCLGRRSGAFILLGEDDAPFYQRECEKRGITPRLTCGGFRTRKHCTILENENRNVTHVQTTSAEIDPALADRMISDLVASVQPDDVVVLSGSLPKGLDTSIYAKNIEQVKTKNAVTVLDSSGHALLEGVRSRPTMIKANQGEAEELIGTEIHSPEDQVEAVKAVRTQYGIPIVVISLGSQGMIAADEAGIWRCRAEIDPSDIVDTVGCGDTIVAGLTDGYLNGLRHEELYRYATACATAAAMTPGAGVLEKDKIKSVNIITGLCGQVD